MTIVNISNNTGVKGNAKWDQQEQQKKKQEKQKHKKRWFIVFWLSDWMMRRKVARRSNQIQPNEGMDGSTWLLTLSFWNNNNEAKNNKKLPANIVTTSLAITQDGMYDSCDSPFFFGIFIFKYLLETPPQQTGNDKNIKKLNRQNFLPDVILPQQKQQQEKQFRHPKNLKNQTFNVISFSNSVVLHRMSSFCCWVVVGIFCLCVFCNHYLFLIDFSFVPNGIERSKKLLADWVMQMTWDFAINNLSILIV